MLNTDISDDAFCRSCGKTGFIKIDDNSYIEHGHYIEEDINTESDVYLANEGYITIVPISLDQTNYDSLDKLKNKFN